MRFLSCCWARSITSRIMVRGEKEKEEEENGDREFERWRMRR